MRLTRQHAFSLDVSEKELNIIRKVLKDEELSAEEEAFSFTLSGKIEYAYAKASEFLRPAASAERHPTGTRGLARGPAMDFPT